MNDFKRVAFHTLGCKLNFSESSDLARRFTAEGYDIVDFKELAEVYVINTCTVTQVAEKKCRSAIRQAIRQNPEAIIAVIGCFAELNPEQIQDIKGVHYILGNADKHLLVDYVITNKAQRTQYVSNLDVGRTQEFVASYSSNDRTRTFLKIQDGCDYFCTYCAIPYARGRNRSASVDEVLDLCRTIALSAVKEVVLTGVNIGEFGSRRGSSFYELLLAMEQQACIERMRISSIEPNLLTPEIIALVSQSKMLMPHFHIPLQSGCDRVLKAMHRKYTTELFADRVKHIKAMIPRAFIAADVIVGFPGESLEDFENTCAFIESLPLAALHVFPYSERPGTPACRMTEIVPVAERARRSRELKRLSQHLSVEFQKQALGQSASVLWESDDVNERMFGFTDNYIRIQRPFDPSLVNKVEELILTESMLLKGDLSVD